MVESHSSSALAAEEEEDSDWEYEYHETETESFYVILDITSAAEYHNPRNKKKKTDPPPPRAPQPATSIAPASPVAQVDAGPSEPAEIPIPEISVPMDVDQTPGKPEEDISQSEPKNRIQVLDLHTKNPLVSYQNRLYSCEWTSTLGTDLLLTAPVPDFPHPVLREKPNVSVLGASNIKLMGRPAQIVSRHSADENNRLSTPAPEASTVSADTASPEKATPIKIPLGATPSRARQDQARFLERLIAIKAKKGENDSVTVYTQKVNQGTGWRNQRKASEAIEDGEDENNPKQSRRGRATTGRPRGSRWTRGPRTAKGGLFRDYRPQLWDTPGADIRAGPSFTPETWDQLEGGASDSRQTQTITTASPPLPAENPVPTLNRGTRSVSASASANASPTPSFPPVQSRNSEGISSAGNAIPSPSLAQVPGLQPATVEESVGPASKVPDAEPLQQKQSEGFLIAGKSAPAPLTMTGPVETSDMAASRDVEMEDVQ